MTSERPLRWDEPLFDAIPDAVLVVEQSGRIVFANTAVAKVFGYQPDDLVGSNVDDLVPPPMKSANQDGLERFFAEGRVISSALD